MATMERLTRAEAGIASGWPGSIQIEGVTYAFIGFGRDVDGCVMFGFYFNVGVGRMLQVEEAR